MKQYDKTVLQTFLEQQTKLFPEAVCDTEATAEEFLEDCMAVVCNNVKEVRSYFEEAGTDIAGMSDTELCEAQEVFSLPDGRFLIVEG